MLITKIDVGIVVPVVISISLTGVYVLNGEMMDLVLTLAMGLIGYLMIRFDYPRLPLVIALVLGETAERSFHQVTSISDGHALEFMLSRPISVFLMIATVLTFCIPILRKTFDARKAKAAPTSL